jgi:hypothetical protein
MAVHSFVAKSWRGKKGTKAFSDMFGPGQVDQMVRHAIQMCWMIMPKKRQTIQEVEKQIRRVVERALKDLREDASAFGMKL